MPVAAVPRWPGTDAKAKNFTALAMTSEGSTAGGEEKLKQHVKKFRASYALESGEDGGDQLKKEQKKGALSANTVVEHLTKTYNVSSSDACQPAAAPQKNGDLLF